MRTLISLRRSAILLKKRMDLFNYNASVRLNRRQPYDIAADIKMMESEVRSMNILDFNRNPKKDIFLLDEFND
jgi:hypothetical protein